ncbi:MAG TPA: ABC transporter ATP-binding protein [Acidimicrobiales bacterium]|nr:ABC transporter ATP-binding protein [Acidimicrobiales bacterium]
MTPGRRRRADATAAYPEADDRRLLEVRDLRTVFTTPRGDLAAVDGVSFTLDRGRTLGVVGESGSGKTVLSRSVMGLLPLEGVERSGSVLFEGRELVGAPLPELRSLWGSRMSMVFQDPMTSLNPVVRVGHQIAEPLRVHLGVDRKEANATAVALLAQVGIPSPESRVSAYPFELSGGMRQRVMMAIALACGPRLLLADEPTTGLDVTVQAQILDLLSQLRAERNMAVILVTHDLGVVATRTDEIAVMYAGRIVERAPTTTLFAATAMPYTEALLASTPRLSDPSHTRLAAIEGRPPNLLDLPPGCPFAPRCGYAQPLCHEQRPPLVAADEPGHLFACWYPLGGRTGPEPGAEAAPPGLPAVDGGDDADAPAVGATLTAVPSPGDPSR